MFKNRDENGLQVHNVFITGLTILSSCIVYLITIDKKKVDVFHDFLCMYFSYEAVEGYMVRNQLT